MLKCIDPTEVREYELSGAIFKLGVLPKGVYAKVMAAKGKGLGYNELWLAVKHGVKGHTQIVAQRSTGETIEVPYETEEYLAPGGEKLTCTSERTMMFYHGAGVINELATETLTPGKGAELRALIAELQAKAAAAATAPALEAAE